MHPNRSQVPMPIRAGVLADTHLVRPDHRFREQVERCFRDCEVIIHAGDITDPSVLQVFADRTVYAVHGNMCTAGTLDRYPERLLFTLGRFTIGLTHGVRLGMDIEGRLWQLFPEADCLIYGHTHRPACNRYGTTLFLNPGSFQATGRYGGPGTYAILEVGVELQARILEIPALP